MTITYGINMLPTSSSVIFCIAPESISSNKDASLFHIIQSTYKTLGTLGCLCQDHDYATYLDDWLWSYKENRFIPHEITPYSDINQVYIQEDITKLLGCKAILNLTAQPLSVFQTHAEHLELVCESDKIRQRSNYQAYKQQGITPQTRKLT